MRKILIKSLVFAGIAALIVPAAPSFAATASSKTAATAYKPIWSGWLPFWKETAGAAEVSTNMDVLNNFSPFSYELDEEVGVMDTMNVDTGPWPALFAAARAKNIKIVPSIATFDGDLVHKILSNPTRRRDHIEDVIGTVLLHEYDGIDIDYEGKHLKTKPYFSQFIKELSARLHAEKKVLSCTVESRTPASSRFNVPRGPMEYANDYAVLNKYCDEIRIMAYDQANIDLKLNKAKGTKQFYLPIADPAWVEKVIQESLKSINRNKLVLGIPTYGYEYELPSSGGLPNFYDKTKSVTYAQAMAIASSTGSTPARTLSGELSFLYFKPVTNASGVTTTEPRIVWFTDAKSIGDKVALVKKYKLRGASFFKFDGDADQQFWSLLKG